MLGTWQRSTMEHFGRSEHFGFIFRRDGVLNTLKDPLKLLMWKMDTCEGPREPGYQILWNAYNHLKYANFNGRIHFDTKGILGGCFKEEVNNNELDFAGAIKLSE